MILALVDQLLYTTVKNVSANPVHLNFVGICGQTLAASAELTRFGTLFDWVRNGAFPNFTGHREQRLIALITAGTLAVLQTPTIVLRDLAVAAVSRVVESHTGNLQITQVQTGAVGAVVVIGPYVP